MTKKKNDIYESACGEFILTPPSGLKLRSYNIMRTTDSNGVFNAWVDPYFTHNSLNILANFTQTICDRQRSRLYMEEYANDYKKHNPSAKIYKDKRAIALFVCKSIKTDLLRLYSS